jgi:hypothetical protein
MIEHFKTRQKKQAMKYRQQTHLFTTLNIVKHFKTRRIPQKVPKWARSDPLTSVSHLIRIRSRYGGHAGPFGGRPAAKNMNHLYARRDQ